MPRVNFVKHARKAQKAYGIKKGDSYYWWKFRYGGKHVSKTRPRQSQLTQSKMSGVYAAQESVEDVMEEIRKRMPDVEADVGRADDDPPVVTDESPAVDETPKADKPVEEEKDEDDDSISLEDAVSDLTNALDEAASSVREVAEEYRESASNMESAFPNGSSKIDELNEKADNLDSYADELEGHGSVDSAETIDEALDETQNLLDSLSE